MFYHLDTSSYMEESVNYLQECVRAWWLPLLNGCCSARESVVLNLRAASLRKHPGLVDGVSLSVFLGPYSNLTNFSNCFGRVIQKTWHMIVTNSLLVNNIKEIQGLYTYVLWYIDMKV